VPRDRSEIIEIGAVLVEGKRLQPLDEFAVFVKPVLHPKLTRFCMELTTITHAALAKVGLQPTGTHHRGLDDARNIARLLPTRSAAPSCGGA
jgi:inhibitor of KinA sporulation pathway (predicted exonuclease)